MASLELRNVGKRYAQHNVLQAVNLQVQSGETITIFGASGCGKTVLLRLIAGVEDPTQGQILIDGQDITDVPPEQRGIGMAFQNFALFPHMTAYDNIASPLDAKQQATHQIQASVNSVARLLKIDHVLGHAPRALSNGQKQRTALARALVAKPKLLLLDDPLRNVDAKLRFEMRLELPELLAQEQTTVLYVTQDYKEAMALGNRIAVLDSATQGLLQVGTPEQIYYRPANLAVATLFGDPTINTLPVQPVYEQEQWWVEVAKQRIALPHSKDSLAAGMRCLLGVRPEALQLNTDQSPNSVALQVDAVTPINEKVVILLSSPEGVELLASNPAHLAIPNVGETLYVHFPSPQLLLFEIESGKRLAPDSADGETA